MKNADFYIVRYGIAPNKLFSNYQIYSGNEMTVRNFYLHIYDKFVIKAQLVAIHPAPQFPACSLTTKMKFLITSSIIVSDCHPSQDSGHRSEKTGNASQSAAWLTGCLVVFALFAALVPGRANSAGGFVTTVTTPVTTGTTSYGGNPCVFMDNGIIHVIINHQGFPQSLRFLKPGLSGTPLQNGIEMIGQTGGSSSNYGGNNNITYSDPANVIAFSNAVISFATPPTAAQADYAFTANYDPTTGAQPWDSVIHWVLRQGNTGLYTYLVINHAASYGPAQNPGLTLLWGSAHDSKNFLLEDVFVDNLGTGVLDNRSLPESRRHGLNPSFEDSNNVTSTNGPAEIEQVTNTDPASKFYGFIESKYSYISDLFLLNSWGRASDINHLGAWFVQGSHEFSPSGPEFNDFTHGWGLVYDCVTSLHGIQANYIIPQGTAFRKVYGPTMLYMNTLSTATANWTDSQQQALAEQAAWPYSWLTYEPGYQTLSQRATVSGTISIVDQLNSSVSGKSAWVGLAAPDTGVFTGGSAPQQTANWMEQSAPNQYWVQAASNGSFTFPHIATTDCYGNPEKYSLYVYSNGVSGSNGVVGEYMGPSFTPTAGQTLNLGALTWTVPHQGTSIVWQIGNPDRSSQEFANYQTSFQPLNWEFKEFSYNNQNSPEGGDDDGLSYLFPNPLEYNTATGTAALLSWIQTSDNGLWPWDLNFNLSSAPVSGNYWLNIAYAGCTYPRDASESQQISVNGVPLFFNVAGTEQIGLSPADNGGDLQVRLHEHGSYSVAHVPIPSSMLHSGSNTVTLTANGAALYDYIDLEAPTVVDDGVYTLSIEKNGTNVYTLGVGSVTATNTQVYTYPGAGTALNQWQVINLGSGRNYCEFINVASGLALTGTAGGVTQAPLVGSGNQIWQVEAGSAGGYLVRCSGQSFTAADGGTITQPYTSGSNSVVLSGASGGAAGQNWVFTLAPPVVSCTNAVATNVNTAVSLWATTGVYGSNFAPSSDYTASGFTWLPAGATQAPVFSATNLPSGLTINSVTGLISGKTTATGISTATITATNSGGTGSQAVTFTVAVPLSGLSIPGSKTLTWGVPYSAQPTGMSGDVTGYSATGLPPGININATTGLISGTPTAYAYNNPNQTYASVISVTNPGGTFSVSVSYKVYAPTPVITSPLTATATTGSSFSYTTAATNAPGGYTASGYPAGLSFNTTTGVLSGTPTATGVFNILLNSSNDGGGGNGPTSTLVLTVYAAPTSAPVISSASTASGTAGAAFSYTITATNLPTSYSASGLPSGLSVNTATGQISGSATSSGASTVSLGATNSKGTGTQNLTLTIGNPAAPVIASSGTVPGEALSPFSYSITASNNPTAYGASGLPAGLSINPTTGVISGTPTSSGSSVVSLSATNQGGTGTGSITLSMSAASKPVLSSSSTDTEALGVPVSFQLEAANGPTSYAATGLPLGLSINSTTGLISGTPGLAGTFSIPITVTNSIGSGSGTLTMTVNPATWTSVDVGSVGGFFGDNTSYANGVYSMVASGLGYVGGADAFQFAYQPLSGDGAIIARVTEFSNPKFYVNNGSQGGVMIRSSLAANAPFFGASVEYKGSTVAQYRTTTGANSVSTSVNSFATPYWVKVVRAGNVFTGYGSQDGVSWAQLGSPQTIVMPTTVYAGLAGNEVGNNESVYIDYDNVNLTAGNVLWSSSDIGTVSAPGNTSYSGGVYTAVNSGADIWNNADQFHYAYLPVTSDCSMTMRVTSVASTSGSAKAGIMIRDTLDPASDFADIVTSVGSGIFFQQRATPGGNATDVGSNAALQIPYWLKLARTGSTFTAYTAPDGVTWTQLGSTSITMGTNAYVGLAYTSHNAAQIGTATVDNISLTATNDPAPPVIASGSNVAGTVGAVLNYSLTTSNSPTGFASAMLPGGLTISSAGVISGAPTNTGNFTASVSAQNSGGLGTNTVTFSFVAAPPVIMPSDAPVAATVNQAFSYGMSVQNGATSYTATGLPPGITFNTSTGNYSGTPTSTGTYSVAETATNASGTNSATQSFTFISPSPNITSSLNPTGTALSPFSFTVTAGNSPTTFDAINLPTGLSINTSTGVISGTPLESGTFTFYVTATNQYGTASDPLSLVLNIPVPEAPTSLAANAWDSDVDLIWDAPYDATAFNVLRATSASGPYSAIASNLTTTYYSDKTAIDGGTYFYEVNASDTTGTGPNSTSVMATPVPLGANAWEAGDIGAVGLTGSTSYLSGTYTINGAGSDIWNTADAFQFNCQTMTGDGAIVARVVSVQNTSTSAKAGVMMRDSLAAGAANAAVLVTPGTGINSQWRTTDGASSSQVVQPGLTAPYWVKLSRAGNVFTYYYSPDGVTWTQQTSQTISMPATIYAGLAVTSKSTSALCTAKFDNVNILPDATWSAVDIGSVSVPGFTSWSNGVLTMNASGSDIGSTSDQFRYVYQPTSGDCTITAEVTGLEAGSLASKTGVMIRETLAANSDLVSVLADPYVGAFMRQRATVGGGSNNPATSTPNLLPPYWVRLTRSGNFFTAYTSQDGSTWTTLGSTTVTMGASAYIGFALSGDNGSVLGAARITNITVTP